MGCIISRRKSIDMDSVQSVIFHVSQIHGKEILIWDEPRARAWMLQRSWLFREPPDLSKHNQIKMIIEKESIFESLHFQDIGLGITIVFGKKPPPLPRRQYINFSSMNTSYRKKRSNIHTLSDIYESKEN